MGKAYPIVSCYRHDNDIPGTPLAVDLYESFVHVAEYSEREHGMTVEAHSQWLNDCLSVISEVLEIGTNQIF